MIWLYGYCRCGEKNVTEVCNNDAAQKDLKYCDINEELVRLKNHIKLLNKTITSPKSVGKKLNFISQEIGREINTIGSKCSDFKIQKSVINMKEYLEKIKENNYNVF